MWDLPGAGLEPVSSALAGGFLTIAPPGSPYLINFFRLFCISFVPDHPIPEYGMSWQNEAVLSTLFMQLFSGFFVSLCC